MNEKHAHAHLVFYRYNAVWLALMTPLLATIKVLVLVGYVVHERFNTPPQSGTACKRFDETTK